MSRFIRTFKARKAFLDALELGSSEAIAAQIAGAKLRNFRKWRSEDPDFAEDWADAVEAGTDYLEDEAVKRAVKKSDPLMMFMLKARRPEKYDRGSKLEVSGGISVEGSKQKLLNKIARLQAERRLSAPSSDSEPEVSEPEVTEAVEAPKLLAAPSAVPQRGRKRQAASGSGRGHKAA
jgi:hypothetical protein